MQRVKNFAAFLGRSPDTASFEDMRRYQGHKDRYVMLSPHLLELLRAWYKAARPQGWLFPGMNLVNPMTARLRYRSPDGRDRQAGVLAHPPSQLCDASSGAEHRYQGDPGLVGACQARHHSVYTRVATKTIREIMSPLDRITSKLKEGAEPPA